VSERELFLERSTTGDRVSPQFALRREEFFPRAQVECKCVRAGGEGE